MDDPQLSDSITGKPPQPPFPHLDFIDAARGWAFFGVIVLHVAAHLPPSSSAFFLAVSYGNYGVQLFFLASSITLMHSLDARKNKDASPLGAFLFRRFFRIAPLFYMGAAFYLWFDGMGPQQWAPDGIRLHQIILTLTFLHGWWPDAINAVVPGGWSIAVEMNFYLLLPWLAAHLSGVRVSLVYLLAGILGGVALSVWVHSIVVHLAPSYLVDNFTYWWLPRQLSVFLLGIVWYRMWRAGLFAPHPKWLLRAGLCLLLLLVLAGQAVPLIYLLAALGFGCVLAGLTGTQSHLLVNGLTRYLGKISFSCYICHFAVLDLISSALDPRSAYQQLTLIERYVVLLLLGLAGTCAVATVTYHLIETPGQWLGRLVVTRWNSRARRLAQPSGGAL